MELLISNKVIDKEDIGKAVIYKDAYHQQIGVLCSVNKEEIEVLFRDDSTPMLMTNKDVKLINLKTNEKL